MLLEKVEQNIISASADTAYETDLVYEEIAGRECSFPHSPHLEPHHALLRQWAQDNFIT